MPPLRNTKPLNELKPEDFNQYILDAHIEIGESGLVRVEGQSAVIWNLRPGMHGNQRFFAQDSIIENIIYPMLFLNEKYQRSDAINFLKAYLDMHPEISLNEIVTPVLCSLINPAAFNRNFMDAYEKYANGPRIKKEVIAFSKLREEVNFRAWTNKPAITVYDLSDEKKSAMQKIGTIFTQPKYIQYELDHLFQRFYDKIQLNLESPQELAAFIHHGIIHIHPFVDGNGRVARRLMNMVLSFYGLNKLNPKRNPRMELEYDSAASKSITTFASWINSSLGLTDQPVPKRLITISSEHELISVHSGGIMTGGLTTYPGMFFDLARSQHNSNSIQKTFKSLVHLDGDSTEPSNARLMAMHTDDTARFFSSSLPAFLESSALEVNAKKF